MPNELSPPVSKIINNYLGRLAGHLRRLPETDREDLVREIYSHIYESYVQDANPDEVQRILDVLDRLGEPSEVVASRLSGAMQRMGKKRNLPFLILAGFVIGVFGIPLGLGGFALLMALGVTLVALILTYFLTAGTLVLAGWVNLFVTTIRLSHPDFLVGYVDTLDQFFDPTTGLILNYLAGAVCIALGLGMFWLGRHVLRGARFLFGLPGETIRNMRRRKRIAMAAGTDGSERGHSSLRPAPLPESHEGRPS